MMGNLRLRRCMAESAECVCRRGEMRFRVSDDEDSSGRVVAEQVYPMQSLLCITVFYFTSSNSIAEATEFYRKK